MTKVGVIPEDRLLHFAGDPFLETMEGFAVEPQYILLSVLSTLATEWLLEHLLLARLVQPQQHLVSRKLVTAEVQ